MEAKHVKINIWKETGKWYTNEEFLVNNLEEIDDRLEGRYKGMTATACYRAVDDDYYYPYRMYRL